MRDINEIEEEGVGRREMMAETFEEGDKWVEDK